MNEFNVVEYLSEDDISKIWDNSSEIRANHIMSRADVSYVDFIVPQFIKAVSKLDNRGDCLDIGCGVGYLSYNMKEFFAKIDGIDISKEAVRIASRSYAVNGLNFSNISLEDYAKLAVVYDVITSNMVLMGVSDLATHLRCIFCLLANNGTAFFMISHPAFWPRYWGFEKADWFDYGKVQPITCAFRTSSSGSYNKSTYYIHRPLHEYLNQIISAGFVLRSISEVFGAPTEGSLPSSYPRYLFIEVGK